MPHYFYSGNIPVPVVRIDGEIVSVKPRSVIEAKPQDVRKYGSRMTRTAPRGVKIALQAPAPLAEMKPSPMAERIEELGGSRSKDGLPPVTVPKIRPPVLEEKVVDPQEEVEDSGKESSVDPIHPIVPRRRRKKTPSVG